MAQFSRCSDSSAPGAEDQSSLDGSTEVSPWSRSPGLEVVDQYGSVVEGRRSYHGYMAGSYSLPNDGDEQTRLDKQHLLWRMALDGDLGLAPICAQSPPNVLDVATGTGAWAIDFGRQNPECQVIGTDLSLIQPARPRNVQFVVTDSEEEDWLFPFDFDYVHFRNTLTSFNDILSVSKMAYDHIQPGGWIEFQEGAWDLRSPDGTLKGTAIERWASVALKGLAASGHDIVLQIESLKSHLLDAGFVDVEEKEILIPGNGWVQDDVKMKQMGLLTCSIMLHAIESYRKILEFTNLSEDELDTLVEEAKADVQNPQIHFFVHAHCVFGQKPQ